MVTVGIDELNELGVNIYPNPSTGMFTIETDGKTTNLQVYAMDGRLITQQQLNNQLEQISLEHVTPGMYMIILERDGVTTMVKHQIH